jgi:murein DD-endopeptidase MepM/ murein hydrolase activator NlpD
MTQLLIALALASLAGPPVETVDELPTLLGEEFDLLEALDQLAEDHRAQERALKENNARRKEVIGRRDRAARAHTDAQSRLERERDTIRRRIRVYIELKKLEDWQIGASAADYSSWMRKRRLFAKLLEGDEQRIVRYHEVVRHYREAKNTHESELAELAAVEKRIAEAQAGLERDKALKIALLESIRTEKRFYAKAGRDLDQASRKLQEKIGNFEEWTSKRLWFRDLKGQYLLPLPGGKSKRSFGKHIHEKFKTVTMHRGVTMIPGKRGYRRVRVIYWGRVVFAGWLKGFGNTIIVDHTKNDYTLYAHLDRMDVKVGDVLKSREVIGLLGASGSLEGEKLYFELRIDGKPVDPARWFRRSLK